MSDLQFIAENGQKLYVRLFGRNYRWIRKNKIVYPKIEEDLTDLLSELVKVELLEDGKCRKVTERQITLKQLCKRNSSIFVFCEIPTNLYFFRLILVFILP